MRARDYGADGIVMRARMVYVDREDDGISFESGLLH